MATEAEVKRYYVELLKVLKTFDAERMREFVRKHKDIYPSGDEMCHLDDLSIQGIMSKMILHFNDISAKDIQKATTILDKLGWSATIWDS